VTGPDLPEPERTWSDPAQTFARYLRYYREAVLTKCGWLPADELRLSRLPSGWTPLELLNHLAHMEQRWFVWGFLGEAVPDPWADSNGPDGSWAVADDLDLRDVEAMLRAVAARTEDVLSQRDLGEPAAVGGRFDTDPPTLGGICFHVLQEYARHAGHLDVVVELAGGPTGE
jgi:uncharacterized damage-inducible protein DinB